MAIVINKQTGKVIREVKNLGWLLRHASEVEAITLEYDRDIYGAQTVVMTADLADGIRQYHTAWASEIVLRDWLRAHRIFHDAALHWHIGPVAARAARSTSKNISAKTHV